MTVTALLLRLASSALGLLSVIDQHMYTLVFAIWLLLVADAIDRNNSGGKQ